MRRFAGLLAQLVIAGVVGCGADDAGPRPPRGGPLARHDAAAGALLARMTLAEKVGQMTQAETGALADFAEIRELALGSLLNGGDGDPPTGNGPADWAALYDRAQAEALGSRLGIPLLYGTDAVHGHSNVVGAVIFPHNIGLGCTRNPALVEEIGVITAREMRATGFHWTFAPCVAVARDERWGRTYESFSEDPAVAGALGAALVRGLQRGGLAAPQAVLATPKHFVADGGTLFGSSSPPLMLIDQGDARMDEATLRRLHLPPYREALAAGAATVMVSYSSWNGTKMSAHRYLLTDVLKGEMGFEGFVLSDYGAIDRIDPDDYKSSVALAINAGIDMGMVARRHREFIAVLQELVAEGRVSEARIDDAVRRILRVKLAMGLMDRPASLWSQPGELARMGSPVHRAVARRAVSESVVVLRNAGDVLPLRKDLPRVHVTGTHADNLGFQCGGWTISWQGRGGRVTEGTTLLEAVRAAVGPATRVTASTDGSGGEGASVVIAAIGERPYAEYFGDRADLTLAASQAEIVRRARAAGAPLVVVLITGRPLILGEVADLADALVVAWLPGTEGAGVTDVLFGDVPAVGRLSFSWPRSMEQIPINVGDVPYDPLFPFGYGLTPRRPASPMT